jgi:hypothetical protein
MEHESAGRHRMVLRMLGVVVGVVILVWNLSAAVGDLQLRHDGTRVTFTVERCDHTGRTRACVGSYTVAGRTLHGQLLLGGEGARAGDRTVALVNPSHPGDATTTGDAPLVEAVLLAVAGLGFAVMSAWRIVAAPRRGRPSGPGPVRGAGGTPRRPLSARARVWEGPGDGED